MLQQILIRTPIFVWVVLAGLIYRGIASSKAREVAFWKLFILPAVMPLIVLPDLAAKFGHGGLTFAAWSAAAAISTLLTWQWSRPTLVAGKQAGAVLVRGSWMPLTVMMALFFTKYALNVLLVMHPQAHADVQFAITMSATLGMLNGIFFGRLARDTTTYQQLRSASPAAATNCP